MGKEASMMRFVAFLTTIVAVAAVVPAGAQTATPTPHAYKNTALQHKVKPMTFVNPGSTKQKPGTLSGRDCISGAGANAGQQTVDPVTGKPKAGTIVSIPLGGGSSSVQSSTTKAQQAQACGHTR